MNLNTHRCYIQTEAQTEAHRAEQRQQRQQLSERRARARGYDPQRRQRRKQQQQQQTPFEPVESETVSVYFDIESMQVHEGDTLKHEPNLLVAGTDSRDLVHWCGPQCIHNFVTWLDYSLFVFVIVKI